MLRASLASINQQYPATICVAGYPYYFSYPFNLGSRRELFFQEVHNKTRGLADGVSSFNRKNMDKRVVQPKSTVLSKSFPLAWDRRIASAGFTGNIRFIPTCVG